MPRTFDFDRYMRDYHSLPPRQRDALVRLMVRAAKEERADAMRQGLVACATWSRTAALRGIGALRRIGAGLGALTLAGLARYRWHRHQRHAAARLHAMDDRMLKDIGLNRGDIDFVLSGAVDRTRISRARRGAGDPLAAVRPKPEKQPAQALPLVLRNACAG